MGYWGIQNMTVIIMIIKKIESLFLFLRIKLHIRAVILDV